VGKDPIKSGDAQRKLLFIVADTGLGLFRQDEATASKVEALPAPVAVQTQSPRCEAQARHALKSSGYNTRQKSCNQKPVPIGCLVFTVTAVGCQ